MQSLRRLTVASRLSQVRNLIVQQSRSASNASIAFAKVLNAPLKETDPELFDIIEHEKQRQRDSLNLIASENFTSQSVFDALGSVMSNKYSEGYPGARYYGGNENIDAAEELCQKRALAAFGLNPEEWGVNVQSLSGSPANFQAYTAVLDTHDRIMSLDLPHGGHLSHGYQTDAKKISAVSKYFETFPYRLDEETDLIDYDSIERNAALYRPKLIVAGASAYSRLIDYERIRKIADAHGAYVLADIAHISAFIATKQIPSPFPYCDIVTTTTHKSLRGPRGAMIFYRKGVRYPAKKTAKGETPAVMYDLENKINFTVFPGLQGGPHNHTISALATALKQVNTPEFTDYAAQTLKNSFAFAKYLQEAGFKLVSGGTDNHLVLVDLSHNGLDGARVERICELAGLTVNKNTVPGDKSALVPSGIRMGTPALTSRGLDEEDFKLVTEFFKRAVEITKDQKEALAAKGLTKLADFRKSIEIGNDATYPPKLKQLRDDIREFARKFPTIGYEVESMKYRE